MTVFSTVTFGKESERTPFSMPSGRAFHVAYRLDEATLVQLKGYGIDLDSTTGQPLHELPVPSVFIIDRTGVIRFVYSNPDFTVRRAADALWDAAKPYSLAK